MAAKRKTAPGRNTFEPSIECSQQAARVTRREPGNKLQVEEAALLQCRFNGLLRPDFDQSLQHATG
jgi:hypothetical protein